MRKAILSTIEPMTMGGRFMTGATSPSAKTAGVATCYAVGRWKSLRNSSFDASSRRLCGPESCLPARLM